MPVMETTTAQELIELTKAFKVYWIGYNEFATVAA